MYSMHLKKELEDQPALFSTAALSILSQGVMTPKSITLEQGKRKMAMEYHWTLNGTRQLNCGLETGWLKVKKNKKTTFHRLTKYFDKRLITLIAYCQDMQGVHFEHKRVWFSYNIDCLCPSSVVNTAVEQEMQVQAVLVYLKLLQPITTATMFFPMSCTSPFTVASTTVPW